MCNKIMENESGMVLVIVLMIMTATVLLGAASMAIVQTDVRVSGNYRDTKAAFFAAEAGVERSVTALRANPDWNLGFDKTSLANGGKYEVQVESPTNWRRKITSVGYYRKSVRKIEVLVNVDSVFRAALNSGGDLTLVGKPRISQEGIRANGAIRLELDDGTPPINVQIPNIDDVTLVSSCYSEGSVEMEDCGVNVTAAPPMDFNAVRLESEEWEELADMAPDAYYFDTDGQFNSKDTDMTLNDFNCNDIPTDGNGMRTLFIDGSVTFTGELSGTCTIVATGKITGQGGFCTKEGTTVSMIAMDDVKINYDTDKQSFLNGLVYTEGDYEMHGKIKYTGVVTAFNDLSAQNPSEFTNNSDPNYWYTYSAAYSIIADPVNVLTWHEVYD